MIMGVSSLHILRSTPAQIGVAEDCCRYDKQADELGRGKESFENETPIYISPKELQKKAEYTVPDEVEAEYLAVETTTLEQQVKNYSEDTGTHRLIELVRVERYVKRHPDDLSSILIGKCHRPRKIGRTSVITSCRETSESANRLPEGDRWSSGVGNPPESEFRNGSDIESSTNDGSYETSIVDSSRLQEFKAEEPGRLGKVVIK